LQLLVRYLGVLEAPLKIILTQYLSQFSPARRDEAVLIVKIVARSLPSEGRVGERYYQKYSVFFVNILK